MSNPIQHGYASDPVETGLLSDLKAGVQSGGMMQFHLSAQRYAMGVKHPLALSSEVVGPEEQWLDRELRRVLRAA